MVNLQKVEADKKQLIMQSIIQKKKQNHMVEYFKKILDHFEILNDIN